MSYFSPAQNPGHTRLMSLVFYHEISKKATTKFVRQIAIYTQVYAHVFVNRLLNILGRATGHIKLCKDTKI